MITRKQYLDNQHPAGFREYYGGIIESAGLGSMNVEPEFMAVLQAEYAGGNVHFNSLDSDLVNKSNRAKLSLAAWDQRAAMVNTSKLSRALRDRGDWPTAAGLVCIIKEIARRAVEREGVTS